MESQYLETMLEFESPEGTLPKGKDALRFCKRIRPLLQKACKLLGKEAETLRLLDVGCSSGALLRVARDMGFEVQGVEPAEAPAKTAKSAGFSVYIGKLEEAGFPSEQVDIVTLLEVIEHIKEPIPLFLEIQRILRPGGLCLIGTGNTDSWTAKILKERWEYFDMRMHGGHICFYNPKSIRRLASITGFDVTEIKTKRVNLAERKDVSKLTYQWMKLGRELLAWPARLLGKGHDMVAILRKPEANP